MPEQPRSTSSPLTRRWAIACLVGVALAAAGRGAVFWLGGLLALPALFLAIGHATGRPTRVYPLVATLASVLVFGLLFEGTLALLERKATRVVDEAKLVDDRREDHERFLDPTARETVERRKGVLTMPPEWERQELEVEGAVSAYRWHGAVHVYDENHFRRTTPFPRKREGVLRVAVFGDSITYGDGIEARWAYPSVLERAIAEHRPVEVLNLGVPGHQTTDILRYIEGSVPPLEPDLVLYGVCQNDFLPSGQGQAPHVSRGRFPIPEPIEEFLLDRIRVAGFVKSSYDVLLRALGFRSDFYDQIIADMDSLHPRFADDVARMNAFVVGRGLPPIVTMVLDQYPRMGSRARTVTLAAEESLRAAGMDLIESEDYYRRFEGRRMAVSPWEGHPNERAQAIFASYFFDRLEERGWIDPPSPGQAQAPAGETAEGPGAEGA